MNERLLDGILDEVSQPVLVRGPKEKKIVMQFNDNYYNL